MHLTPRQSQILKTLVEAFVETARPVGSKAIAERLNFALSPASIRNTMADLEEIGAIEKPHTSAGRIPTKEGYRYYVEHLMSPETLGEDEIAQIDHSLSMRADTHELLEGVARTLAKLSRQLGIIVAPHGEDIKLFRTEFIPISANEVSVVVLTTNGMAKSVPLRFNHNIDFRRLHIIFEIINERLSGRPLSEIRATIERRFEDIISMKESFLLRLINSADTIFHFESEDSLHYYGTSQLLDQPEFRSASNISELMSLLENRSTFTRLLEVSQGGTLNIRIGASVEDISIITCEYETAGNCGIVGIVGPLRMDYARSASILIHARNALSRALGL